MARVDAQPLGNFIVAQHLGAEDQRLPLQRPQRRDSLVEAFDVDVSVSVAHGPVITDA